MYVGQGAVGWAILAYASPRKSESRRTEELLRQFYGGGLAAGDCNHKLTEISEGTAAQSPDTKPKLKQKWESENRA